MSNLLIKIADWLSGGLIVDLEEKAHAWGRVVIRTSDELSRLIHRHNTMLNSVTQACVELPNVREYVSRLELENDALKKHEKTLRRELDTRQENDVVFQDVMIRSGIYTAQLQSEKQRVERLWEETHVELLKTETLLDSANEQANAYEALLSHSEDLTQRALEQLQKAHADNQALLAKIKKLETKETFRFKDYSGNLW